MSEKTNYLTYFAYGSNMHPVRLQQRVPSCRFLAIGKLTAHQLKFHKHHQDGSGKCNIHYTGHDDHEVHGVLYQILATEKALLDVVEGVGYGYNVGELEVMVENERYSVFAYIADPLHINDDLNPYPWYKALVVTGAAIHGLPQDYITHIERHETMDDHDEERIELHMEIVHAESAVLKD